MTPTQCKMARAAADLSVHDLAKLSGVSANTVSGFERGKGAQTRTVDALRSALLETKRIEFIGTDTVRVIKDEAEVLNRQLS